MQPLGGFIWYQASAAGPLQWATLLGKKDSGEDSEEDSEEDSGEDLQKGFWGGFWEGFW